MTVDMIREALTQVYDVERLLSRIAYKAIQCQRLSGSSGFALSCARQTS